MKRVLLIMVLFMGGVSVHSQQTDKTIQQGNQFYKQQQYDQAEIQYNDALKLEPSNNIAAFNLANTSYRQGKKSEAITNFDKLATLQTDAAVKAKSWYNKGVALSSEKRLEESVEAYKNALRQNPDDMEARENLQKALLELKKKTPPPKKKEEDKKKKKQDQQQQKKQPPPKMNPKEAEQRLKLLEQKEKEVQQRLQKEKSKTGFGQNKDW